MSITDLHICQNSESASSKSETDSCQCPPEYYCTFICDEGREYSLRTPISWQHFPRSTSSRSRCDDSSTDVLGKSASDSTPAAPTEKEKQEETTLRSSANEYPITKSFSQLKAQHYLEIRHIYEFLNFLISHLVCNEPEDPVQFLVDLLGKCLRFRDSFGEPPLLFTHNHIKSLYAAFDPFERGHLTQEQYEEAMKSLGLQTSITPYNRAPPLTDQGFVEENFFAFEAERCLIENLKKMVRVPKLWEENRLLWKKRMEGKAPKELQKDGASDEGYEVGEGEEEGEVEGNQCRCALFVEDNVCRCSQKPEINHDAVTPDDKLLTETVPCPSGATSGGQPGNKNLAPSHSGPAVIKKGVTLRVLNTC